MIIMKKHKIMAMLMAGALIAPTLNIGAKNVCAKGVNTVTSAVVNNTQNYGCVKGNVDLVNGNGKIVTKATEGEMLIVQKNEDGQALVKLPKQGVEGYLKEANIIMIKDGNANDLSKLNKNGEIINVDTMVNVREMPSINSSVKDALQNGTAIKITGKTAQWYSVEVNGTKGYIFEEYVSETTNKTPVVNKVAKNDSTTNSKKTEVVVNNSSNKTSNTTTKVDNNKEDNKSSVSNTVATKPSTGDTVTKPEEKPSTGDTVTKPEEKPSTGDTVTKPEEKPSTGDTVTKPEEKPSTGDTVTKPEEKPSTGDTVTKPEEKPSTGDTVTKPEEKPSTGDTTTKPEEKPVEKPDKPVVPVEAPEYQQAMTQQLWSDYNNYRQSKGLKPLAWSNKYAGWTKNHAKQMAEKQNAFHMNYPEGGQVTGFNGGNMTAESILNQFKSSPAHNQNLLEKDLTEGACAVYKYKGVYYFVIGFDY
ncbi:SH3 domain-containing protein [Clostridium perfringens]|nr:SH3 domain-containing protein [Clostridium perfringens]EGT0692948.1 SH3 domain-containing protein [Clostridium perfringens]EGT0696309.1 SH3 domain-containing protein [Clostridium perfringens]